MNNKPYHVIRHSKGGWAVTRDGCKRCIKRFETKFDAELLGLKYANLNGSDLYVHDEDARVVRKYNGLAARYTYMGMI